MLDPIIPSSLSSSRQNYAKPPQPLINRPILSPAMASPSSRKHTCPHQCGCDYSTTRENDLKTRIPDVDQDHPDDHYMDLGKDQPPSWRAQGTRYHPQIRSLITTHCEQLSSGLMDIFRTEVEREVKHRVSEVIVSEATAYCEQFRLKDEALLAVETRCKGLQEQLELSDQTCCQLQERVRQLEATEAELRNALNERLEVVRSFHPRILFSIHPLSLQLQTGVTPLDDRHLTVVYERKEGRMLCRLCV